MSTLGGGLECCGGAMRDALRLGRVVGIALGQKLRTQSWVFFFRWITEN